MNRLLRKFTRTGVLVVGDLMLDQYIHGDVRRISPEAPVPVVEVAEDRFRLGGAANVAHNIRSLGGNVFISGVIGKDRMGRVLVDKLEENGIRTDGIIFDGKRPTSVKTRVIAHSQQVVRFDREMKSDIGKVAQSRILDYVRTCLPSLRAIIVSDYCKGVITRNLIGKLREVTDSRVFISVDPKIGHFDYYHGVNLITPNVAEASFGSGVNIIDRTTLVQAGRTLLRKLQCDAVLITRGHEGMSLFEKDRKPVHISTSAKEVYDVTGAGDTVIATITLLHAAGKKLRDAAEYANLAAGIVISELGTAVVRPKDLIDGIRGGKS